MSTELTREEWMRRYAARIMDRAGWNEWAAINASEAGADAYEDDERAAGNALVWDDPEGMADEEMSCWSDDGDD